MKNLVYIIAAVLTLSFSNVVKAQVEDTKEVVTVRAELITTMSLQLDNDDILFRFVSLDHYKNGLGGYEGEYLSQGSISSTANWNLSFKALGQMVHADVEGAEIPLDNIGLTAKFTGSNEVKNYAEKDAPLALSLNARLILGHDGDNSNAGDAEEENKFDIYWEMGTKKGDMNKKSVFQQDLVKGAYSTNVEFVLSEVISAAN